MNATAPLPVTLIGGYLGAGKTTLVNNLLRHAGGLKLAVLVNEFGELPIDADLIEAQDDDLISIAGGCICCSYGDDMLEGIQRLRDMPTRPDHLIIEASGVAMPQSIAAAMSLVRGITLHTIVVMTDAETLHDRCYDKYMGDTVVRQLNCADLVIVNRCDLATSQQTELAYSALKKYSNGASCLNAIFAKVPIALLLDRDLGAAYESSLYAGYDAGRHDDYESLFVDFPDALEPDVLCQRLVNEIPGLVRAKGFVTDDKTGQRCLVQLSGKRVRVSEADELRSGECDRLGLVLIGVLPLFDTVRARQACQS